MPISGKQHVLVVYYSYTGGTQTMAESMANTLGADLAEIHPIKPYPSFKPWVYIWGGMQAVYRLCVPIHPLELNPEAYRLVIVGTPVWGNNMAPPVRSWLALQRLQDKQIALFASSGGGDASRAFKEMKSMLAGNVFLKELTLSDADHNRMDAARLAREWANRLLM